MQTTAAPLPSDREGVILFAVSVHSHSRSGRNSLSKRRRRRKSKPLGKPLFLLAIIASFSLWWFSCRRSNELRVDVAVYGGTSAGVMAALAVAKEGKSVVIIEPGKRVGGMTTGGLSKTDIVNRAVIGGLAREFYRRTGIIYGAKEAWNFEPKAAQRVFNNLVRENNVPVLYRTRLRSLEKSGNMIKRILLEDDAGKPSGAISAKVFIDASYEGDLMAKAGVSYVVGRESKYEFKEPLNGIRPVTPKHQFKVPVDPYVRQGDPTSGLLPLMQPGDGGKPGDGDRRVQAYNFRLCLTQNRNNFIPISPPKNYDPYTYELLARYIAALLSRGYRPSLRFFLRIDRMPNGKTDINNNGAISTDFIGMNWDYPNASYAKRARIWQAHENYTKGLLYFLGNDPRVPANVREEMKSWGYAKDEFVDNGGFPTQLYIREARRMRGRYVITQIDCENIYEAADSIAMGSYSMDSHNCQRIVRNGYAMNEGDVQVRSKKPYPISFSAVTPLEKECGNLLVPVCLSATHIAYSSIRMEPVLMAIGQAVGIAAAEAIDENLPVQKVNVMKLRTRLALRGQVLSLR